MLEVEEEAATQGQPAPLLGRGPEALGTMLGRGARVNSSGKEDVSIQPWVTAPLELQRLWGWAEVLPFWESPHCHQDLRSGWRDEE